MHDLDFTQANLPHDSDIRLWIAATVRHYPDKAQHIRSLYRDGLIGSCERKGLRAIQTSYPLPK